MAYDYQHKCGKQWYQDRTMAKQAKKELSKLHSKEYIVYKCPTCDGFHLSTKEKGVNNRIFRSGLISY